MDIHEYNRHAWNRLVASGNKWTVGSTPEEIAAARTGKWEIYLTPTKPVPVAWFPPIQGCLTLCLASGGGQQGPILAAAGADVTVVDASDAQLDRDREVADREGLSIRTIMGDMTDLGMLQDGSFDLIVHPVSNCFAPDILPVWQEAFRVLRIGGALLTGFNNPINYLWDTDLADKGELVVRYALPYSDLITPSQEYRDRLASEGWPLEFSHSLDDQIGGQIAAGFHIAGFYEDKDPEYTFAMYYPAFMASRAIKPIG